MTRIDDLPPDQRAVLELVLGRGRDYDDISGLLSVDRADVRRRALGALDAIGPDTDVPAERRALITDYLLGQLPASVAGDVRERLATSEADRAWARAVAAELAPLAERPLPDVPDAAGPPGRGGGLARQPGDYDEPDPGDYDEPESGAYGEPEPDPALAADPGAATAGPAAAAASTGTAPGRLRTRPPRRGSRVGGAFLLGIGALVVAVVLIVVFVIKPGSGTSHKSGTSATAGAPRSSTSRTGTTAASPKNLGTFRLKATAARSKAQGIAEAVSESGQRLLALVALGLAPNSHNYYAVWLTRGTTTALVGYERVSVTKSGRLQAFAPLPSNASRYTTIVVALQSGNPQANGPRSLGTVVLSGPFGLK